MMHLRLLIIAVLFLIPGYSFAEDGYGYPIEGAYEATILGTPAQLIPRYQSKITTRELVVKVLPERRVPPIFFYDTGLRSTFAWQKGKAPLVFIIAGSGSSDRAEKMITMLKAFHQAGYHVITLPSPLNANFIISVSRTAVVGDLTEDAADIYRAMEAVWNEVKGDIEISSFNLCGYSLGADEAAFVAKLDEERKVFNFRKVLMINPSVSLYSSLINIEELLKQIPGGPAKQGVFFNNMLSKFSEYYRLGNFFAINDDFLYSMYKKHIFSQEEMGGLIGLTFRLNLAGMIFTSDVMTNSGYVVPKNRVLHQRDSLYDYFMVSSHLSYFDYFNEYFYPFFARNNPGLTKQALTDAQSLKSIEPYLASSQKFGVMLNENDFILTKDELHYLQQLFGPRAKTYPRGGHLGNLEYKDNLDYMVSFFNK
jgi:hypothetical protein